MKKVVRSPGSATIINAIATGFGSAFGIGLDIVCNAKTQSHSITCSNDVGADTSLMELCVSNVFDYYGVDADEFGLDIKTTSELPMASGLSSSSALSNAVTAISSKIISEEFNLEPLSDFDIINLAIESSLKAKVTITGAFDDATASYFGGVTVTDNGARKILIKEPMEELPVLVYMPNFISKSGSSDVNKMKLMAPLVETAFEIFKAVQERENLAVTKLRREDGKDILPPTLYVTEADPNTILVIGENKMFFLDSRVYQVTNHYRRGVAEIKKIENGEITAQYR